MEFFRSAPHHQRKGERENVYERKRKLKLQVITKVTQNKLTCWQAQKLLGLSSSSVRRQLRAFETKGIFFVKHGNTGRRPSNKTSDEFKDRVEKLVREKYSYFNVTHLREMLEEFEGIHVSRQTLNRWMSKWKLVKRKKRPRKYKPRFQRDRMPQRGLMIQMDGSHHRWFGDKVSCLIATIDDATKEIPYAEFFDSENTQNCLKVIQELLKRFGVFHVLYVDKAGIYGGTKRTDFSQLKRACEDLGIHVIFADSPQGKGRIERLFDTFQDRLVSEMKYFNVETMEHANRYLQDIFLPLRYTPKFTLPPLDPTSAFRPLPPNLDLTEHFCIKQWRQINHDHTVSWQGWTFRIDDPLTQSIANHYLEFRMNSNRRVEVFYNQKPIQLKLVRRGVQNLWNLADVYKSKSLGIKPRIIPGL